VAPRNTPFPNVTTL